MSIKDSQLIFFLIILFSVLILLMSCFIISVVYKYQQKQNLYYHEITKMKVTHENDILQAQIEMQEQTFINISREIHDNVGQKLTLAKLHLINLKDVNNIFGDISNIIGNAIDDLRDLSRTLSSNIITDSGLIEAIKFEISQINKANLFLIDLIVSGERVFLDAKKELIIFRILQEALHNIIKHSTAQKAIVDIQYNINFIKIKVHDNGKGFIKTSSKGQGLINIESRAKNLGGAFRVSSTLNVGTKIEIEIPINETISQN